MKEIAAKSILSGYKSEDNWFGVNYNMNLYKGCCHGCIYCDSRSNCYGIENFDEVRVKKDALHILEKELRKKRKKGVVGLGSMNDPYNPFEAKEELTRGALKLLNRYGFGVSVATKSSLVERDLYLFHAISKHSPVIIKLTITTCQDELSKKIEPNVSLSSTCFHTLHELSKQGLFTGILMMPLLPFLEDTHANIQELLANAHKSGARFVAPSFGVTLRDNQRQWFFDALDKDFPGLKRQYLKAFGNQYNCQSPHLKELASTFRQLCHKYDLLYRQKDIIEAYKKGYGYSQVSLFDL